MKTRIPIFGIALFLLGVAMVLPTQVMADRQSEIFLSRVRGVILLQVESKGEAWYVHPNQQKRFYLGRPKDAFEIMRELGLGISNQNLEKLLGQLPDVTTERVFPLQKGKLADRFLGNILLQVESHGEAYYLNPRNKKAYYLGRPKDAFDVMRGVGLGVTNQNLARVTEGTAAHRPSVTPSGTGSFTPGTPGSPTTGSSGAAATPGSPTTGTPVSGGGGGGGTPPSTWSPGSPGSPSDQQTTFNENYTVEKGKKLTARNGATLTFKKNLTVDGVLDCEGGPLHLVVEGDLTVSSVLQCNRQEGDMKDGDLGIGMSIVVLGNIDIQSTAYVVSNASVLFVDSADLLPKTTTDMDELFADAAKEETEGSGIGPFVSDVSAPAISYRRSPNVSYRAALIITPPFIANVGGEMRVGEPNKPIPSGAEIVMQKPPKGVRRIVLLYKFGKKKLKLDFTLDGPPAHDGEDIEGPCTIDIPAKVASYNLKQQRDNNNDAMRLNVRAPIIEVNNFTYNAPAGGRGGNATTGKNCDPGTAKAGHGGESGNLKMMATQSFKITGSLIINPGKGGNGGVATAYGKEGKSCGEKGGSATAVGGNGADNKKTLRISGGVLGAERVRVGSLVGGNGGNASAKPGSGGSCPACGKGGDAGDGAAPGGKGGDVLLTLKASGVDAKRTDGAEDRGGDGGNGTVTPGQGGHAGDCDCIPGKDGGKGGDATATAGAGGTGIKAGDAGRTTYPGGNGGIGGDGEITAGVGGDGGGGAPPGQKGADGAIAACIDPNLRTDKDQAFGTFELYRLPDWTLTTTLPIPGQTHVVIASSGTPDVRTHLPILVTLLVDGSVSWSTTIANDPVLNCRGADGCSIDGPSLTSDLSGKRLTLEAWGKNGDLLARYEQ